MRAHDHWMTMPVMHLDHRGSTAITGGTYVHVQHSFMEDSHPGMKWKSPPINNVDWNLGIGWKKQP